MGRAGAVVLSGIPRKFSPVAQAARKAREQNRKVTKVTERRAHSLF